MRRRLSLSRATDVVLEELAVAGGRVDEVGRVEADDDVGSDRASHLRMAISNWIL